MLQWSCLRACRVARSCLGGGGNACDSTMYAGRAQAQRTMSAVCQPHDRSDSATCVSWTHHQATCVFSMCYFSACAWSQNTVPKRIRANSPAQRKVSGICYRLAGVLVCLPHVSKPPVRPVSKSSCRSGRACRAKTSVRYSFIYRLNAHRRSTYGHSSWLV